MKHPITNLEKAVVAQQQIDKIVQNGNPITRSTTGDPQ